MLHLPGTGWDQIAGAGFEPRQADCGAWTLSLCTTPAALSPGSCPGLSSCGFPWASEPREPGLHTCTKSLMTAPPSLAPSTSLCQVHSLKLDQELEPHADACTPLGPPLPNPKPQVHTAPRRAAPSQPPAAVSLSVPGPRGQECRRWCQPA